MEEISLLEEMLHKAVESEIITSAQERFYLLKYRKGELTFLQIQEEIATPSKRVKTGKKSYPVFYDRYVLKTCLGTGGMGEIFEAYNRETWQKVALKKIKTSFSQDPQLHERIKKRFMRECSLQAKLDHPNIVKVYDYGVFGKEIFLVTQLIEGETLDEVVTREIQNSQIYYEQLLPLLLEQMVNICDGVQYAHENGIVHRDINPHNIMVDQQQMWIMDFGLAKRFDIDITKLTQSSEIVGTPSYMAPEQWNNGQIGPVTDVYSLGATIYYLVTGQPPQPEETFAAAYNIINQIAPRPIERYGLSVPRNTGEVIQKAMAYHPVNRYDNAKNLGEALKTVLSNWNRKPSFLQKLKDYWQQNS